MRTNAISSRSMAPETFAAFIGLFVASVNVAPACAAEPAAAPPKGAQTEKPVTSINIGYLRAYAPQLALSVLDVPPRDEGVAGAKVAIVDNNTTGKFMGQQFSLDISEV